MTVAARRRLASTLSFVCPKRMVMVHSGLSRASIRVGREFVRLGRRSVLRHMARKRRRIEEEVSRIGAGRGPGLILVRRGTHDGLL